MTSCCCESFLGQSPSKSFFDVKVFNPHAPSYRGSNLSSTYRKLEREIQRKYEECTHEVEMGCFTPLVFSTLEGCPPVLLPFSKD